MVQGSSLQVRIFSGFFRIISDFFSFQDSEILEVRIFSGL